MSELQTEEIHQENEKESLFTRLKQSFREPVIFIGSLICLLLFLNTVLHFPSKQITSMWQYKVVNFYSQGYERTGSGSTYATTIYISESDLTILGVEGWELVSTSLETETAYPNFGNASYVTGIQPNVRPQKLICIFKRQIL